jgi:hypothetical protein
LGDAIITNFVLGGMRDFRFDFLIYTSPTLNVSLLASVKYEAVKHLPGLLIGWSTNMTMGSIINCAGMCNARFLESKK